MATATEVTGQAQLRPFHETIVRAIEQASGRELPTLAMLISATKIPKDHDKIIGAWNERGRGCLDDFGVTTNLLQQKREAEEKAESKKRGINLDELQQETEKLLVLLKEREESGMGIGWSGFMNKRLENLHKLTSQALGK